MQNKYLGFSQKQDHKGVDFPEKDESKTKSDLLKKLAAIYNPLEIVSPWLYQEGSDLLRRWKDWVKSLPAMQEIPQSIPQY